MDKINELEGKLEQNKKQVANGQKLLAESEDNIKDVKNKISANKENAKKLEELTGKKADLQKKIDQAQKDIKSNQGAIDEKKSIVENLKKDLEAQKLKTTEIQTKLYRAKGIVIPRRKDRDAEKSSEGKNKKIDEAKKKEIKKHINRLKEAVAENKISVKAGEFLLEKAPKQIAPVKDKLTMLVNNAKGIIEKSEKVLTKLEGLVD